jgi:exopolysaccharide biosynthesis protein
MKKDKMFITTIILDALMVIFLFFTYGPITYFRELLITSAMATKSHKYIARTLYSEKTIAYVMSKNTIEEVKENTNSAEIEFVEETQDTYESIYEEQVLKHDADEEYKIVELKGDTYFGYMMVVYNPENITLAVTPYLGKTGLILRDLVNYYDAKAGINAGGFADAGGVGDGGTPTGTVIKNGKVIYTGPDTGWQGGLIGFNKDHVLVLTKETPEQAIQNGMVDAVEFGPFLIVNGKSAITTGNGGSGLSSRTVIAQRQDGIVLFFVIDGRQPGYSVGISLSEMVTLLEQYKAYNAANLDGGASTTLVDNNTLINKPCGIGGTGERRLPNAWIIM